MYTGQIATISNRATWLSDVVELVDPDDDTTTDLTAVSVLDIEVTIRGLKSKYCDYEFSGTVVNALVTASIDNGKVTVPGPGFQWQFDDTDLSSLSAGTYRLGVKVTMDGFVVDLIDGTITVVEGN
jgi:hypothetical protein